MKCFLVARIHVRLAFRIGRVVDANSAFIRLCGGITTIVVIMPSKVSLVHKDSVALRMVWVFFHEGLKRFTAPWQFIVQPLSLCTRKLVVELPPHVGVVSQ